MLMRASNAQTNRMRLDLFMINLHIILEKVLPIEVKDEYLICFAPPLIFRENQPKRETSIDRTSRELFYRFVFSQVPCF